MRMQAGRLTVWPGDHGQTVNAPGCFNWCCVHGWIVRRHLVQPALLHAGLLAGSPVAPDAYPGGSRGNPGHLVRGLLGETTTHR